jgi:hypothetical protein
MFRFFRTLSFLVLVPLVRAYALDRPPQGNTSRAAGRTSSQEPVQA